MNQDWNTDEIIDHCTLLPSELKFLGKNAPHNHLGKALMLKFFQHEYHFPDSMSEIPQDIIEYVAQQLDVPPTAIDQYDWGGTRMREHRVEIRQLMGFKSATMTDQDDLRTWLMTKVLPHEYRPPHLEQLIYQRLRRLHIEPPTRKQISRLIASAIARFENEFFTTTNGRLSSAARMKLRQLIYPIAEINEEVDQPEDEEAVLLTYPIHELKVGAGAPTVNNIKKVAARLKRLQEISLPLDLFADIPLPFLQQYKRQVAVESISHLRRRNKTERQRAQLYTMLAAFCWVRQQEITDYLVDLFIRTLNNIRLRAKSRIEKQLVADYVKVGGKQQMLFRLAQAMWNHPTGVIEDVLYPIVGKDRLEALVEEAKQQGPYRQSVQTQISGSYTHHYRQMLPPLLEVLSFHSNNEQYKPLIEAMEIVAAYLTEQDAYYPKDQEVPIDDVIQKQWRNWIYQNDSKGQRRIRRVRYELCVLQSLREKLRCKEIWVDQANRYRNPDEDVPADFSEKRDEYYDALNLPQKGDEFVKILKQTLTNSLQALNDSLPTNSEVEILAKGGGWIKVTPLTKQKEPTNLRYLKNQIKQRWWMTSLLDIVKEADFRIGFTNSFQSLTGQQRLAQDELQKRLLLCLFGLGTNTGLTSVSMGNHGISYDNLKYIRRRFISKDAIRHAIGQVVNATMNSKQANIWGENTTWCASDSKQFGSWNQNLRAQWHKRYRQAGVMVYWRMSVRAFIYSGG